MDPQTLLAPLYDAINRHDVVAIGPLLTDDIDWPDQIDGGRLIGLEALAAYWARNELTIRVELAPYAYGRAPDGRLWADVVMNVQNLRGQLWSESTVRHLFTLRDGRVARIDGEAVEQEG